MAAGVQGKRRKYLLCSRNISSAEKKKKVDEGPTHAPNKTSNPITHVRFALEVIGAASGKDIDEPNNPTRKQIQSIAVAPFHHADIRARK
jgi:hypothetical protein